MFPLNQKRLHLCTEDDVDSILVDNNGIPVLTFEFKSVDGIGSESKHIEALRQCLGYAASLEIPARLREYEVIEDVVMLVLSPTWCYIAVVSTRFFDSGSLHFEVPQIRVHRLSEDDCKCPCYCDSKQKS
eukprot:GHVR01038336.1.p1 GENE.GHVR01038336.1~~GHVR01038336.1.p1  ORF type:complete len:130 (+),score=9.48 GHVR01038336.1:784-1173(+)